MGCLPWFRCRRRKQHANALRPPDNDLLPVRRYNTSATTDDEKPRPLPQAYLGLEKVPIPASADRRWDRNHSPLDDGAAAYKSKDEAVDDPEEERRRKQAEAARRKAEEEEQERLDFFQMM